MENQLSIINTEQEISLDTNKEDIMSLFVKSLFAIVPFGSPIGEVITAVIPQQKLERVIDFVQILNYKIKHAERKIEEQELKTVEFADLLEDALAQASRAMSKERLEHIASLLKNSLTNEELEHIGKKKLLSILNELNDVEIIYLKNYSFENKFGGSPKQQEFYNRHKNLLEPISPTFNVENQQSELDKQALQKSYESKILQLGLIEDKFCSRLGNLLLKFIDVN